MKDSSEGRPEERHGSAEKADSFEKRLDTHNSSQRIKLANCLEKGQIHEGEIHDSSEETSAYCEESKSGMEANGAVVKDSTKGSSRDKSDKKNHNKTCIFGKKVTYS